jgi:hypothetical protein
MSPENVEEIETLSIQGNQTDDRIAYLLYSGTVGGYDTNLMYVFLDNELVSAVYQFSDVYTSSGRYLSRYESIKNILEQKYGTPENDREIWNNESAKQYTDLPTAFSLGYVQLAADFTGYKTYVQTSTKSNLGSAQHLVVYFSTDHKMKYENYQTSLNQADF